MVRKAKKKASKKTKRTKKVKRTAKKSRVVKASPVQNAIRQSVKAIKIRKQDYNKRKLSLVLGNLTFFVILFVVSTILYSISTSAFYVSLFFMLSLVMGVFSIALLIVLLVFVFLKFAK